MKGTNKGLLCIYTKVQDRWIVLKGADGKVIARVKIIKTKGKSSNILFEADRDIKIYKEAEESARDEVSVD